MKPRIVCGREAVAKPNPCVKHRPSVMDNDIAANRISCTPQKLQGMSAIVKIGRDGWRRSGKRAGRNGCHTTGRSWNQGVGCPAQRNTFPYGSVDPATVNRWAVRFLPLVEKLPRKHARQGGDLEGMDRPA